MTVTCGTFLFSTLQKKILLCHPTNTKWNNWSIPKGVMEQGEQSFDVASRELKEETGIDLLAIDVVAHHPCLTGNTKSKTKFWSPTW